jgi:hypothetical protein
MKLEVPITQCHRLYAFVASIAVFIVSTLSPARAFAHDVPSLPANVTSAVVRVDAYEHSSLGAVIGDGHLVLVPFAVIEVARPGWPHAIVIDTNGVRHDAGIAATDRASGLALLAVERAITSTPLAMSPSRMTNAIDTFAIGQYPASGPLPDAVWSFYPAGALAGDGRFVSDAHGHATRPPPRPAEGSPVIDTEGRLVAIMGTSDFFSPSVIDLPANALARLDGTTRARRPLIFYGGFGTTFSFATDGGLWFGLTASLAARVRDVVELRLDGEFSALVPAAPKAPRAEGECAQRACYAGVRGVATPSIGYRYVLGGFGGTRAWPIALTSSIGVAFGLQETHRANGATVSDAGMPSTWSQLAPGLALSIPLVELRGRVRVPLDGTTSPTVELGFGLYF